MKRGGADPLVSVILCTRNRPQKAVRSLRTAFRQIGTTHGEFILVDNGDGHATAAQVSDLGLLQRQLRFLSCGVPGVCCARNYGASVARGKWLAFLDDDCVPDSGWWAAARKEVRRRSTLAFGGPALAKADNVAPSPWFGWECEHLTLTPGPHGKLQAKECLFEGNFWIRRDAFRAAGGFPDNAGPRGDRWKTHEARPLFRALRKRFPHGEIRYLPAMQVRHLIDPEKLSFWGKVSRTFQSGLDSSRFSGETGSWPRFGYNLLRLGVAWPGIKRACGFRPPSQANQLFLRRVFQAGETLPRTPRNPRPQSLKQALPKVLPTVSLVHLPPVACRPSDHANLVHNVLENRDPSCQRLRNAVVRGPRMAVWDSSGNFLDHISVGFPGSGRPDFPKAVENVAGESLVLASTGDDSYFHWMMDVVPRLGIFARYAKGGRQPDNYIFNALGKSFHQESLKRLGIPGERVRLLEPGKAICLESAILPSLPNPPGIPSLEAVSFLRKIWPAQGRRDGKRMLYLRRVAPAGRLLENEREILGWLKHQGFTSVDCGRLSVREQSRLMQEAGVVVAPHGGALTNLVFAGQGTKVIELFGGDYVNACYRNLAGILNLEYGAVLEEPIRPHRHLLNPSRSFMIELASLREIFRTMGIRVTG